MERRDYLLHQIQEMGAFLVRLILRLKKKEHQPAAAIQKVSSELEEELDLVLKDLLFLEDEAFVELLQEKLVLLENMEQFASLLEQLGDVALVDETFLRQQLYYHKAIVLLDFTERESQSFSMERQDRIAGLRLKING
jgi:hypothetical protein